MTNVQVRDVPEEVVELLKRRAANRGLSLQRYLRCLLEADAGIEANSAIFAEAAADQGGYRAELDEPAEEIRRARAERDRQTGML